MLNSLPCEKVLSDHKNYCRLNKPAKVVLPDKADNKFVRALFLQNVVDFPPYKSNGNIKFCRI